MHLIYDRIIKLYCLVRNDYPRHYDTGKIRFIKRDLPEYLFNLEDLFNSNNPKSLSYQNLMRYIKQKKF